MGKLTKPEIAKFLPLTPAVFYILLALSDGEKHGYYIMQQVAVYTQGQMRMGPGTLYGTLKRMLRDKLVEESEERPDPQLDDQRRRYYRLTNSGTQVVQAEVLRLENLVKLARATQLFNQ